MRAAVDLDRRRSSSWFESITTSTLNGSPCWHLRRDVDGRDLHLGVVAGLERDGRDRDPGAERGLAASPAVWLPSVRRTIWGT